jgi:hypothetical protein
MTDNHDMTGILHIGDQFMIEITATSEHIVPYALHYSSSRLSIFLREPSFSNDRYTHTLCDLLIVFSKPVQLRPN